MELQNIKLIVEYNGTNYSGWQSQKNGDTIQDRIEKAIFETTGQNVNLTAAGRTDAGVHALGQTANFNIEHQLYPEKYKDALNFYLPKDIRIISSEDISPEFNSRFDAVSKRYRYMIGLKKSALYYDYRWEIAEKLDFDLLKQAARIVMGEHDFAPFCVTSSRKENNNCHIYHSRWSFFGPLISYEISGNRFLHSMIRSLVGAMVNLASVKKDKNESNLTLDDFKNIIISSTEERIKFTAPACGLYLVSVQYPA